MKLIDTTTYIDELRKLVEDGKEVCMIISGSSMSPFLIHRRDSIYFSKPSPDRPFKKGDMVFYQRTDGAYVMHRIYKIKGEDFYMIGDAQVDIEGPLKEEQIFALITKVKRKGKIIKPGDFWWWFFEYVWLKLIPLRPYIVKLYSL